MLSERFRYLVVRLCIPRSCWYRIIRILYTFNWLIDYVCNIQTSHISSCYIIRNKFHRNVQYCVFLVILHLLRKLCSSREFICIVSSPEISSAYTIRCNLKDEVHAPTINPNIVLLVKFQKLRTKLWLPGHGL